MSRGTSQRDRDATITSRAGSTLKSASNEASLVKEDRGADIARSVVMKQRLSLLFPRVRFLLLVVPAFAIAPMVEAGCTGQLDDEFTREDPAEEPMGPGGGPGGGGGGGGYGGYGGYGGGYGYGYDP